MTSPLTKCPACQGKTVQPQLDEWGQLVYAPCGPCQGTGRVRAQRVCPGCKKFKSVCGCKTAPSYTVEWFHWEKRGR